MTEDNPDGWDYDKAPCGERVLSNTTLDMNHLSGISEDKQKVHLQISGRQKISLVHLMGPVL